MNSKYMIGDPISEAVEKGLRRIRFRRQVLFCLFAGWLPLMAIASCVLSSEDAMKYLALIYMGAFLIAGLAAGFSICPRCKHLFFISWWSNAFAKRCMNCGLPLSGVPSDD